MAAVRYVVGKGVKKAAGSLQLACLVKPGVNSKREGIPSVTDSVIELCVSAQAKGGEANNAARELIAEVGDRFCNATLNPEQRRFGTHEPYHGRFNEGAILRRPFEDTLLVSYRNHLIS
jgi:hypothetical protein